MKRVCELDPILDLIGGFLCNSMAMHSFSCRNCGGPVPPTTSGTGRTVADHSRHYHGAWLCEPNPAVIAAYDAMCADPADIAEEEEEDV